LNTHVRVALAIAASVIVSLLASPSQVSAEPVMVGSADLESCLGKNNKLAVLMLIDESKSLREFKDGSSVKVGNDPLDSRVPALGSVLQVLASAVESSELIASANSTRLEVAVAVSGFGDGYNERVPFQSLTSKTLESIVAGLELQRDRDSDLHTRYHVALQGAMQSFEKYSTSPEVCRLLVWFSDGEHDDDNSPGFVASERDQIQGLMCGEGGIVDALRQGRVNIVAAGLNADERKLGLMRLIAQGGAAYTSNDALDREGRVDVSVGRCGSEEPNGRYALAESADEIVDKLFEVLKTVPGIPSPDDMVEIPSAEGAECEGATGSCSAIEFQVDESVASFQILAERPSTAVEVVLTTNEGQTYPVLPADAADSNGGAISRNTVTTTPVTARKAFISVTRKKENSIEGTWRLEFVGDGSRSASATVNFVGLADVALLDASGNQIESEVKASRFEAQDLGIRVSSKTSGSAIRGLQVDLVSFEGAESLTVERAEGDDGLFLISGRELERALQTASLKKVSSTDLRVQPLGDVPGLRFKNGTPVPIVFGAQTFTVRVSNGADFPSFVRVEGDLSFEGTPKRSVRLVFRGPDSGDGVVEFKEAIERDDAKANLELIRRGPCVIAKGSETTCAIELIPDEEAFDQFQIALSVEYSGSDTTQGPVAEDIPLDVTMLLQPKASRGVLAAVYLLVFFLVVQGLVRWFLAFLVSRFAPLSPTARRVRLDAVVDASGSLSFSPNGASSSQVDEGFAFENTESVQSFSVFGYDFSVSVFRTFRHSTVAPLGQVNYPGRFVIGSRGYVQGKEQADGSTGQVSLSLRGQWIVGIGADDLQRLINGDTSVPVEVVAFLEPYEHGQGRDQQITELAFGIAGGSFSTQFMELLESRRSATSDGDDGENEPETEPDVWSGATGGDSSPTYDDPFGTAVPVPDEDGSDSGKESSRRGKRSRRDDDDANEPQKASTTEDFDPFA